MIFEILENGKKTIGFALVILFCAFLMTYVTEANPDDLIAIVFGKMIINTMKVAKVVGFLLLGWGIFLEFLDRR
jgi:hypothetical protein